MKVFNQPFIDKVTADAIDHTLTYFRDANLPQDIFAKYKQGLLIQEVGNFDASVIEGGMTCTVRYNIYTSQTELLKKSFTQYKCWTFERGCYFKVLDTYTHDRRGLVTLLHVPGYAVPYFALNRHDSEEAIVADSRRRFENIHNFQPEPEMADPYWIKRTAFPLGITSNGGYAFQFDYSGQDALDPLYERKGFFRRLFKR